MKSILYVLITLIVAGCFSANGADGFAMIGGTTTGGGNGPTTTVSSAIAFSNAVVSGGGVVLVQGTINLNLQGIGYMPIAGNQTIIGLSTNATVIGNLQVESGNVIFRNLFISNPTSNGEGDGLSVSRLNAKHIWIDHCTFSDCLDGEVDITKGADYVTVSWCKFLYTTNWGHNFPNLIGDANTGTPDTNRLHVTFHHNWWSALCMERMPRVRFGRIHSYNNYFNTAVNGNDFTNSHCVTAALYSEVRIENNHFENVRNPWDLNITVGATTGKIYAAGNAFVNVTNIPSPPTAVIAPGTDTVFAVPYCYTLDSTNSLAAIVTNSAGAGRPAYDLATNSWSTGSGKWENPGSWSLDGAPSLNDYANLITIGDNNTVTIDAETTNSPATMTISNLTLSGCASSVNTLFLNDAGTNTPLRILNSFAINSGGALLVTNAALLVEGGALTVNAATDDASLTLQNKGTMAVVGPVTIGGGANSTGLVVLTGGQLVITNNPALVRAGSGFIVDGSVTLTNGSSINVKNGDTIVGNRGSGSFINLGGTWQAGDVFVGAVYEGMLTIAGGSNTLSSDLIVGRFLNVTGAVWVTGGQLLVTNDFSTSVIASNGVGQMTVSNGTWLTRRVIVGRESASRGTLTVAGGTNMISSDLNIGYFANAIGAVWVTGGELTVMFDTTYIGGLPAGIGQMTVSNGTWWARDVLVGGGIDASSRGTLTVAGGTNTLDGRLSIGGDLSSNGGGTGTVWLTGGQLTVTNSDTYVGYSGVGQMTVSNGTWLAKNVKVGAVDGSVGRGTLTVAGGASSVFSNLTIGNFPCGPTGTVVVAGGSLFITNVLGNSTLEVRSGTLTLSGGTLVIDKLVMTNSCGFFTHPGGTLNYGIAVLDPARDDDGDGISNGYEQSHGLDPLNPTDAALDPDGDGFSNLQEFQAGTDATNSASVFRISAIARQDNTNILVTWTMGPDKTNALQRTAGAGGSYSNNFADIFTVTNTVGTTTNYLDVGAATNFPARYYRIRLVP